MRLVQVWCVAADGRRDFAIADPGVLTLTSDHHIEIAGKPHLEIEGDVHRLRIPLTVAPAECWRGFFEERLASSEIEASVYGAEVIVHGNLLPTAAALDSVEQAVDEANHHERNSVEKLVQEWWDGRNSPDLVPEPMPTEARLSHAIESRSVVAEARGTVTPQGAGPAIKSPPGNDRGGEGWLGWSLGLGIASVFFGGTFGILPIVTIGVAIVALGKSVGARQGRWKAWTGLASGVIFFVSYMYNYGHIG